MAVKINPKRRPQLVSGIAAALNNVWIDHRLYVSHDTLNGFRDSAVCPQIEELKGLAKIVGEDALARFAAGEIQDQLRGHGQFPAQEFSQGAQDALSDLLNVQILAEQIVSSIESLPRRYSYSFPLSEQIDAGFLPGGPWPIGTQFEVAKGSAFTTRYPFPSATDPDAFQLSFAGLLGRPEAQPNRAHLTLALAGYMQPVSLPGPTQEAADHFIRSFFGLALAYNVFRYQQPWRHILRTDVYVHELTSGKAEPKMVFPLDSTTSRTLEGIQFVTVAPVAGSNPSFLTRAGDGLAWVGWILNHPKGERVVRAARWYFDSFGADSLLMQIVQATVTLEILLGDGSRSDTSVVSTLKNRCAYLIGKKLSDREQIMRDISEIYDIRSNIVHNGFSALSATDRQTLTKLRWYCARVIQAEASQLGELEAHIDPSSIVPTIENATGAVAGQD